MIDNLPKSQLNVILNQNNKSRSESIVSNNPQELNVKKEKSNQGEINSQKRRKSINISKEIKEEYENILKNLDEIKIKINI